MSAPRQARRQRIGFWLGVLGVALFAITLPATRLATGTDAEPQLSPGFVTAARAALAGLLSLAFLLLTRSPWPARGHWRMLLLSVGGNLIGFPLLVALALRSVSAAHGAVILAVLPLATAAAAALLLGQRERLGFWLCALAGCALVVLYAWLRAQGAGGFGFAPADVLLLGAVIAAAIGYVAGARLTPVLGAERVICWMGVLGLPLSLPLTLWLWPDAATLAQVRAPAWAGVAYVGAVSMWSGFFAWFRGLDWGGALRVSQVLLLQPFLTMLFAVPLLGERLDALSLGFATAVVLTVFVGRRLSLPAPAVAPMAGGDPRTISLPKAQE